MHSNTFYTRVRDSEMRDSPSAGLSACFCWTAVTAPLNAIVLGSTGEGGVGWMGTVSEEAGLDVGLIGARLSWCFIPPT